MTHVTILVNGEPRQVAADTTVAALLGELRLDPRHVAVEVNLELVRAALMADERWPTGTGWKS